MSASDISPSLSSSHKLWMFLVPGRVPHVENESYGRRVWSQSERDCGVANWWFVVGVLVVVKGIIGNLMKRLREVKLGLKLKREKMKSESGF